jgi:Type II secretion system (T2SS), protein M
VSARDRTIVGVVVLLAALAAGWFLVIQPKRQQASKLGAQLSTAQSELSSIQAEVAGDEAAKSAFAKNYTTLARLGEAVPANDNVPSLVYQLQNAASGAKVDFRGLQLNPASSSSSTAPTTSSSASQAATAALPPGAAVGEAGFPIEPFTFTFQGNFFHLSNFFRRLQQFVVATDKSVSVSGRLMTLNAISLQAAQAGFPQIHATISATTYLIPQSQGLLDGATAAGPGASSSVSVSTPSSGSSSSAPAVIAPTVR